jgi:hypothetical protein
LKNHNADKVFCFKSKKNLFVEIKTIEEHFKNFFTFKVCALKSCIKQKACIVVPRLNIYYLIPSSICESFLSKYEHKIYPGFSSNDISVRIPSIDMEDLVKEKKIMKKKWMLDAKQYIDSHKNILFREKAR